MCRAWRTHLPDLYFDYVIAWPVNAFWLIIIWLNNWFFISSTTEFSRIFLYWQMFSFPYSSHIYSPSIRSKLLIIYNPYFFIKIVILLKKFNILTCFIHISLKNTSILIYNMYILAWKKFLTLIYYYIFYLKKIALFFHQLCQILHK